MGNPRPRAQWQKEWPLLRREAEYATIYTALVGQSEARGVVVIGDAGVGKTTLARLGTESLPSRVQWVTGTQTMRSIPLGVFAHFVGPTAPREPVAFSRLLAKPFLRSEIAYSASTTPICWISYPLRCCIGWPWTGRRDRGNRAGG